MAERDNRSQTVLSELSKVPAFVNEWKPVFVLLGAAITTILTSFGLAVHGIALVVGWAVATSLLAIAGYVFYRLKRKRALKRRRDEGIEQFRQKHQPRTAFRGLYPYQEGDSLPGPHRQRETLTLLTQVTDPYFSFGILCGDSGCGKTSLLRSGLESHLTTGPDSVRYRVLYVNSPRDLFCHSDQMIDRNETALQQDFENLSASIMRVSQGLPTVLLLDQFEEFFIRYRPELRPQIGGYLNILMKQEPGTRILCAVRRDYLADMRDLAPAIGEPLSVKTLFVIRNFTVAQATAVIRECAETDSVDWDDAFARTLAEDLAELGEVRPTELQIVCTALTGHSNLNEYRLSGGARGILTNYIRHAVDICGDSKVGAQLLRALCDFPTHTKRSPQTIAALINGLVTSTTKTAESLQRVNEILIQFETDRLVCIEMRAAEPKFSLVHDYLVDAVALATADDSTKSEEAHQLLHYYVTQSHFDHRLRIPFHRIRFIQQYADPDLLRDSNSSKLLRKSRNRYLKNVFAIVLFVVLISSTVLAAFTTSEVWESVEIGRHYSPGLIGSSKSISNGTLLFTSAVSQQFTPPIISSGSAEFGIWDTKQGRLLKTYKEICEISPSGKYVLFEDPSRNQFNRLQLDSGEVQETQIPVLARSFPFLIQNSVYFNRSESAVAYYTGQSQNLVTPLQPTLAKISDERKLRVWSFLERKVLTEIDGCEFPTGMNRGVRLLERSHRVIALCRRGSDTVPTLFDGHSGKLIVNLAPYQDGVRSSYDVSENEQHIVTTHRFKQGRITVRVWDAVSGEFKERDLSFPDTNAPSAVFSQDGEFIILSPQPSQPAMQVLKTFDLTSAAELPNEPEILEYWHPITLGWPSQEGTIVWKVGKESKPMLLRELKLITRGENGSYSSKFSGFSTDSRLIIHQAGPIEFFDLIQGVKIRDIEPIGVIKSFFVTLDRGALGVRRDGGWIDLYNMQNGDLITSLTIAGDLDQLFYDAACQRVHAWTREGRVLRIVNGWKFFNRWFRPHSPCN